VILELVGGENLAANLERLALKGRISVIGTGAGSKAEVEFGYLTRKRGRIHGSTLRARTIEEKAEVMAALGAFLAEHELHVPVEETFPLERTQDAYERFRAGNKFGKIVVCP
jgi:NADPH:quinone reductase-like Zn-dependent oxidoreductase